MNRRNDNDYGDDYRGGRDGLGYRNYDESRYTNNNRRHRGYEDIDRNDDPMYYTDNRGREYMGPWTEEREHYSRRGYDMRDDRMYDPHRAERKLYGDYGREGGRERYRDHDDRGYEGRSNDRYREYYEEQRNPRFGRSERFGESHQHNYHARTSDNWDRPAAYNTGGYGAEESGMHGYNDYDRERYEREKRYRRNDNDRGYDRGRYNDDRRGGR
jgi:hypothetical protein